MVYTWIGSLVIILPFIAAIFLLIFAKWKADTTGIAMWIVMIILAVSIFKTDIGVAFVASSRSSESFVSAIRADIAGFLILDPLFRSNFAPVRNCPQNDLLPDGHGEVIDMLTGELIALMASGNPFFLCAVPDAALPAVHEQIF